MGTLRRMFLTGCPGSDRTTEKLNSAQQKCVMKENESRFQKVVTLISLLSSSGTIRDGACVVSAITNMYWGLPWDVHCAGCWGYKDNASVLGMGCVRILIQCKLMLYFYGYRI